jgi:hypothetical protein
LPGNPWLILQPLKLFLFVVTLTNSSNVTAVDGSLAINTLPMHEQNLIKRKKLQKGRILVGQSTIS